MTRALPGTWRTAAQRRRRSVGRAWRRLTAWRNGLAWRLAAVAVVVGLIVVVAESCSTASAETVIALHILTRLPLLGLVLWVLQRRQKDARAAAEVARLNKIAMDQAYIAQVRRAYGRR